MLRFVLTHTALSLAFRYAEGVNILSRTPAHWNSTHGWELLGSPQRSVPAGDATQSKQRIGRATDWTFHWMRTNDWTFVGAQVKGCFQSNRGLSRAPPAQCRLPIHATHVLNYPPLACFITDANHPRLLRLCARCQLVTLNASALLDTGSWTKDSSFTCFECGINGPLASTSAAFHQKKTAIKSDTIYHLLHPHHAHFLCYAP